MSAYEFITGWWVFLTFPTHIYRYNVKIFLHSSLIYTEKKGKSLKIKEQYVLNKN